MPSRPQAPEQQIGLGNAVADFPRQPQEAVNQIEPGGGQVFETLGELLDVTGQLDQLDVDLGDFRQRTHGKECGHLLAIQTREFQEILQVQVGDRKVAEACPYAAGIGRRNESEFLDRHFEALASHHGLALVEIVVDVHEAQIELFEIASHCFEIQIDR